MRLGCYTLITSETVLKWIRSIKHLLCDCRMYLTKWSNTYRWKILIISPGSLLSSSTHPSFPQGSPPLSSSHPPLPALKAWIQSSIYTALLLLYLSIHRSIHPSIHPSIYLSISVNLSVFSTSPPAVMTCNVSRKGSCWIQAVSCGSEKWSQCNLHLL